MDSIPAGNEIGKASAPAVNLRGENTARRSAQLQRGACNRFGIQLPGIHGQPSAGPRDRRPRIACNGRRIQGVFFYPPGGPFGQQARPLCAVSCKNSPLSKGIETKRAVMRGLSHGEPV